MKKQIVHEINSLPPLPSSVIELDDYKNTDNIVVVKLIDIIKNNP